MIRSFKNRNHIGTALAVLLACTFICGAASAYSFTEEWNGSYSIAKYTDLLSGVQTPDGGYVFSGLAYDDSDSTSLLLKTDAGGVEEWSLRYDGNEMTGVAAVSDGYLFVTSYSSNFINGTQSLAETTGISALVKVDSTGQIVWQTPLTDIWASDLTVSSDGTIAVAGWIWTGTNNTDGYVGFFDQDGSEIARLEFTGKATYSISPVSEGGWVAGGSTYPYCGTLTEEGRVIDGWAARIDEDGSQVWYADLPGIEVLDVLPVSDGGFLLSGSISSLGEYFGNTSLATNAWVGKVDSSGKGLWNGEVAGWQISDSAEVLEGVYVTAGQWGNYAQVQVLDEDGNTLDGQIWEDYLGNFNCVIPLSDGGYVVSGYQIPDSYAEGYAARLPAPEEDTQSPSAVFGAAGALLVLAAVAVVLRRQR